MSTLDSKVVAITGASSGIGAATAVELAARGAAVVLGARRTDRLDSLVTRIQAKGGRAEMLEVLRSDYIKFARARGLTARAINFSHALRNTMVPVITIVGLQFGGIVAFSLVTETVFQWPGVGLLLAQSIAVADIPVMSAYLLLVSLLLVTINLVVDLLYYVIDPRLRVDRGVARVR